MYQKAGQPEKGLAELDEALVAVNDSKGRLYEPELLRLKGELLLTLSPKNETKAEACFLQAIKTAHRQNAKTLELRATVSLSRLWQKQGKQEEARQMLAEVYGWFTEGFDTADLKAAKTLLEELS